MRSGDTIVAVSSGAGVGWRAIVRVSGVGAFGVMEALTGVRGGVRLPRWERGVLRGGLPGVGCGVLVFKGPRSFTGEDLVEIHLPGSAALVRMVVEACVGRAGVRSAEAGEFSARAFFGGKIDLTEAEGIAATIAAGSERELRAAASLRGGVLHKWIAEMVEKLADMLARLEAGIDFSEEEDVTFVTASELFQATEYYCDELQRLLSEGTRVDRLGEPPSVVFLGKPNVGKSSLINALTGSERSIVSPIAGTTRDMLSAILHTDRGDIRILDVPGEETGDDELRVKMMAAREQAILEADLIVTVAAGEERTHGSSPYEYPARVLEIENKVDLLTTEERNRLLVFTDSETGEQLRLRQDWQLVSAKTGYHISELGGVIAKKVMGTSRGVEQMAINQRHRALLQEAKKSLSEACMLALFGVNGRDGKLEHPELLAAEMRLALDLLGRITGTISPDEILGRVFSKFCIGK